MIDIPLTPEEWKESIKRSEPCECGCRLIEIAEDGIHCPRCNKLIMPYPLELTPIK